LQSLSLQVLNFGIWTSIRYLQCGYSFVLAAQIVDRYLAQRTSSAQPHKGFVDGNTRYPCRERGFPFETVQVDKRLLESLLDNIFSVFSNPHVALRKRKNSWPMAPDKRLKCLLVAPLGSGHKRLAVIGLRKAMMPAIVDCGARFSFEERAGFIEYPL
jgi:hypothetical protein